MGDSSYCNGPKVSGLYARNIFSFGEDESGKMGNILKKEKRIRFVYFLFFLGELYFASSQSKMNQQRRGAFYQLIDPER